MKILEIRDLSKSFKGKLILDKVNLTVEETELVCMVGPSGCGKSTLLNIIMGFDKQTNGTINSKNNEKVTSDKVMVFQDFDQLFPWLTVIENVCFAFNNKIDKKEQIKISKRYLDLVGLKEYYDYYPKQLSGGMKQRASIARALVLEPKILCMDEPFASLDIQTRSNLQNLLLSINKDLKTTILFVTHDIDEAILLSKKIVILTNIPTTVVKTIDNDLPYPRDRYSMDFKDIVMEVKNNIN
jgi:NitT/TauT family transport system ATP-binding protein